MVGRWDRYQRAGVVNELLGGSELVRVVTAGEAGGEGPVFMQVEGGGGT